MARPKKTPDEASRHPVKFLLTDAELAQLRAEADAAGVDSVHHYARLKILGGLAVSALPPSVGQAEPPGMVELRLQLIRVGSNINQIARQLNIKGEHLPDELAAASRDLNEIFARMFTEVTFH